MNTPFAISPDGTQLVLDGPPLTALDWQLLKRVRRWLGLEPTGLTSPDRTVTRVVDVGTKKEIVSWPTPYADFYKFSPDGRTLAMVDADRIAFYDAPLHDPWLRKLTLGFGVSVGTFLAGWLILGGKPWIFWRRRHP
jgi:hypothetical protein